MNITYILLLLVLSFCWGPSFFFIKIALTGFTPLVIVCVRLLIGFAIIFTILTIQKQPVMKWLYLWKQFLTLSLLVAVIPWTLLCFAEQQIGSALAGIMNSSVPIITIILAHFFLDHEKFSKEKVIGIFIGFFGVVLIFIPSLLLGFKANLLGFIYLGLSCVSQSFSIIYVKKHLSFLPNLIAPVYQLFFALIVMIPLTSFFTNFKAMEVPSLNAFLSLIVLGVIGTALAFIIFFYLIKHAGATYTSTVSLLLPLIAIFFGVVFLKEQLLWTTYIGSACILVSLVITNSLIKLKTLKNLFKVKED